MGYLIGNALEKSKTISVMKVDCWENFLKKLFETLTEAMNNFFNEEIDKMLQKKCTVLSNEKSKIENDRQEQTKTTEGWFEELNRLLREVKDIRRKSNVLSD